MDIGGKLVLELVSLLFALQRLEAVARRLNPLREFGVVLLLLPAFQLVEDLGERLDFVPVVDLRRVQLVLHVLKLLRVG